MADRSRQGWLDVAKALGIFLVVVGHTLRGLVAAGIVGDGELPGAVDRWIYAFHMPLFFVVSGMLVPADAGERLAAFAKERCLRLGYPYLVWAPLAVLLQVFASRYANHAEHLSAILHATYDPPLQFWFLYALLVQSLVFGALSRLGLRRAAILVLAALAYVAEPLWHPFSWGVANQARHYFFYFALGGVLGTRSLLGSLGCASLLRSGFASLAGFAVVTAMVARGFTPGTRPFMDPIVALAGTTATLGLGVVLARSRARRSFEYVGRRSLDVFVAHSIASAAFRIAVQRVLRVESVPLHLVGGVATGLFAPLALGHAATRLGFPYLFTWPSRERRDHDLRAATGATAPRKSLAGPAGS